MCACVDPELHVGIRRSFYSPGKLISKATRRVFFFDLIGAAIGAVAFENSNDAQTRSLMCNTAQCTLHATSRVYKRRFALPLN